MRMQARSYVAGKFHSHTSGCDYEFPSEYILLKFIIRILENETRSYKAYMPYIIFFLQLIYAIYELISQIYLKRPFYIYMNLD